MLNSIAFEQMALALPPTADSAVAPRRPYGARSEAAVYVGELLMETVPSLASGDLELVAVARRPGVLTKIAIRPSQARLTPIRAGIGADHIARVRHALDGEPIDVVTWQRSAPAFIADALGLAEPAPTLLLPALAHARVLLGEIDVRGLAGWRGINVHLASALTGWRIRLESVADTSAWARLRSAHSARRPLEATVVGRVERGVRVVIDGLFATVTDRAADVWQPDQVIAVRLTRLDAEEGRIFAAPAAAQAQERQPRLAI